MLRKIVLGMGAAGVSLAMLPLLAAFEAHVVNVTARIENALSVSTEAIKFGTVFPQEHLNKELSVRLSGSFETEGRVDDVSYFIRQKPKCAVTNEFGTEIESDTWTGHVVIDSQAPGGYTVDCDTDKPAGVTGGGVLPSLCPYISKEGNTQLDPDETNDGTTPSFHQPWTIVQGDNPDTAAVETSYIDWLDTPGYLSKLANDHSDVWNIDLAVPCFGGNCAQDWADFVDGINPDANPDDYTQDIDNEHKIFGCNLWIEVNDVSETPVQSQG